MSDEWYEVIKVGKVYCMYGWNIEGNPVFRYLTKEEIAEYKILYNKQKREMENLLKVFER